MKKVIPIIFLLVFSNISANAQWYEVIFPSHWNLKNASFIDQNTGYVVGQGYNQLFRTTTGGGSWDSVALPGQTIDVEFISATTGFVLIDSAGTFSIKTTTNGGNTWSSDSLPSDYYQMIRFTDANNGFAANNFGIVYHTTNGGNNWSPMLSGGYSSATDKELVGPDTIIFTGWDGTFAYQGTVIRRDGSGAFQERIMNTTYSQFNGSFFLNGHEGYAVFTRIWPEPKNYLVHTVDGGTSWDTVLTDTTSVIQFNDVWMNSSGNGFIVGTDNFDGTHGGIYSVSGTSHTFEYGIPSPINRIFAAGNSLWVLGNNGEIYKTSENIGLEPTTTPLHGIYPNPASDFIKISIEEVSEISLININGQVVLNKIISPGNLIPVQELAPGIYIVFVSNSKGRSVGKVVLQ